MTDFFAPIHRAGWPFIAIFAIVTIILMILSKTLGFIGIILTGWCIYFFRNPRRVTPQGEGLIVSSGDGIVAMIEDAYPPAELNLKKQLRPRISIFLNIFDVHVNRLPIDGMITKIKYHAGKFLNASLDKASDLNERNSLLITAPSGHEVVVVQIAGLIARRILCDAHEGQVVKAGSIFGMIRFGSRVDIYLPVGVHPQVVKGQRMIGGETIIGNLLSKDPQRSGEVRS
jgi:phosphatidylserine decarboxylase